MTLTQDAQTPVVLRTGRPLTGLQRGLWASQRRAQTAPLQNMVHLTHLDGAIDRDRLAAAFASVVAHSDALRTRIVDDDGEARVHVTDHPAVTTFLELTRDETLTWAADRARRPLDMSDRAYDSVVISHPDGTSSWYLAIHHTTTDATSSALVFDATAAAYEGHPLTIPSFYQWANGLGARSDKRVQAARDHWQARPEAPRLGRLYRPVRHAGPASTRHPARLDEALQRRLQDGLAGPYRMLSDDLAWATLLMTAVATLLHRVGGGNRFAIGLPVHNRSGPDAAGLIGPVMEVFPVDVEVRSDDSFADLHNRVGRAVMQTVRFAQPGTAPAAPDIETVVNVIVRAGIGAFGDIPTTTEWIPTGAVDPNHLLRVQLSRFDDQGLRLALDCNDATAPPDASRRVPHHFLAILEAAVTDPSTGIGDVELLTDDEIAIADAWGDGGPPPGDGARPVTEALAAALADRADTVLEHDDRSWTGTELLAWIHSTAQSLRRAGVAPGDRVGIEVPRSADALVAIYASLFVGASYVPLDPAQPRARLDRLIERAGCAVVVREVADPGDGDVVGAELHVAAPDDEAYLLFTSGSTGEPKGVPISHRGLSDYVAFAVDSYFDDGPPVAALFSALTFDLTVTTLFAPILAGGRVVVIDDDGPAGIRAIAERPDITWAKATPSHLELLVRMLDDTHRLSTLVVGGEAFTRHLAGQLWAARPELRMFNEYGPTEAVVGCMIHEATPGNDEPDVPIGVPAPGVVLRVVDSHLKRVPVGAVGELCIRHRGMTRGYLDGDDAMSPFVDIEGERYYRSGDLVRLVDDHTLTYMGRADEQMKVGGIRLDPSEVENALAAHPAVARAAVRLWSPRQTEATLHCARCGLPSNVPGVAFDDDGVCDVCHAYDRVEATTRSYFRTRADLEAIRDRARAQRRGRYDCIHLLSGGKDSTYALYQLVEMGFDVYALTLDNGFISEGAKENVRRSVAELGIDHEFATTEQMNAIFRDSLERHSNVCHGCYKTIYTLATNRAVELGAPVIVTGLSRGQLFETRLIPAQFDEDRFDPDAIDRAVVEARKAYHRLDDGPNRLLDTAVFADDEIFERISYVDFYRYVDVELAEMLEYLDTSAPWVRPDDTGRSTNCLVNAAGIHTHIVEQGFHNYAEPYAWDVRLGHKTRAEAMAELDDQLDMGEVQSMLDEIGYRPQRRETLTAWIEIVDGAEPPTPAELRTFLGGRLPGHSIPAAFVIVDEIPMTTNGKLDVASLPEPGRIHRQGPTLYVSPTSPIEEAIVAVWERILRTEPIGVDDDFFALGGDSLAALEMAVAVGAALDRTVREEIVFTHSTPRALAAELEHTVDEPDRGSPEPRSDGEPPPLSAGEQAMLFERAMLADDDPRYNVARRYVIDGPVDHVRLRDALHRVVDRHVPLHWTYADPRVELAATEALRFEVASQAIEPAQALERAHELHRAPIDIEHGPLGHVHVQPLTDATTAVTLVFHHVSVDASSFDRIWNEVQLAYRGAALPALAIDYGDHAAWQLAADRTSARQYWLDQARPDTATLAIRRPDPAAPDGYVHRRASLATDELRAAPGATPFTTVVGALVTVLQRYSNGTSIPLAMTASTRDHADAEPLVGYYLNTVPLTVELDPTLSWAEAIARTGAQMTAAMPNRTYPFADIVADRRRAGLPVPDASVLVAYEDLPAAELGTADATHEVLPTGVAVTDASFFVQVRGQSVTLGLEHRGSLIDAAMAQRLLDDLDAAISAAAARPADPIGGLALPSATSALAHSDDPSPTSTVVHDILAHVEAHPHAVAARCGDVALTWQELGDRSASLAGRLAATGVTAGDRVMVSVSRSVALPVAVLAVLRIGATYVPADPTYPGERLDAMARGAGAAVCVATSGSGIEGLTTVEVDIAGGATVDAPAFAVDALPSADDEAYVIFTSGSTGVPRGVAIAHHQLARSTAARADFYGDDPERFMLVSSISFDSSIVGLFWTLATGGTLVIPSDGEIHNVDALVDILDTADVTHTLLVPTLYRALLERGSDRARWPRQVIVAGEASTAALVTAHLDQRPASRLTNEYGPTEATVWATAHHCTAADTAVPIGRPVAGLWTAVVDEHDLLRPRGVAGELLVGGANVASGYLTDHEATRSRFVEHPPHGPGWAFRTGDLVTSGAEGLEFLGRADHQLNVGGARVEPEEIERVLRAVPGVTAAVVVAADTRTVADLVDQATPETLRAAMADARETDDPAATLRTALGARVPGGRPQLVAHVQGTTTVAALDAAAAAALAATHRPTRYVVHDDLPQLPNGKIDRQAVAALEVPAAAATAPSSDTPDDVLRLWRTVLDRPDAGPHDDFFDLGGHSLLAIELVTGLERIYRRRIGISELFETRTAAALAARLGRPTEPSGSEGVVTLRAGVAGTIPLWLIPPTGGNHLLYENLARHLDPSTTVLGVPFPGTQDDSPLLTTVEALADHQTEKILAAQPHGPFRIVGFSLGGVLAFEIAKRLTTAGHEIELLAGIDAGLATAVPRPHHVDRARTRELARHGDVAGVASRAAEWVRWRTRNAKATLRRAAEDYAVENLGLERTERARLLRVRATSIHAAKQYRGVPADLGFLFYSGTDNPATVQRDLRTEWQRLALGGVEIVEVSGCHDDDVIMQPPHIDTIAADLRRRLSALDASRS